MYNADARLNSSLIKHHCYWLLPRHLDILANGKSSKLHLSTSILIFLWLDMGYLYIQKLFKSERMFVSQTPRSTSMNSVKAEDGSAYLHID